MLHCDYPMSFFFAAAFTLGENVLSGRYSSVPVNEWVRVWESEDDSEEERQSRPKYFISSGSVLWYLQSPGNKMAVMSVFLYAECHHKVFHWNMPSLQYYSTCEITPYSRNIPIMSVLSLLFLETARINLTYCKYQSKNVFVLLCKMYSIYNHLTKFERANFCSYLMSGALQSEVKCEGHKQMHTLKEYKMDFCDTSTHSFTVIFKLYT